MKKQKKKANKVKKNKTKITLSNEKKVIIGLSVIVVALSITCLMLVSRDEITLQNGEQVVAGTDFGGISADELYRELKDISGIEAIVRLIDGQLLNELHPATSEMRNEVDQQIAFIKEQTGDQFIPAIQQHYGVNNEVELHRILLMEVQRDRVVDEYLEGSITDQEIREYYENTFIGDIQASHILIKPDATENDTLEAQAEAEDAARTKAEGIIRQLNDGADFAELAERYSDDAANASQGGDLGFFNRGAMVEEFEDAAIALSKGEFTKEVVETQFGFHIILKTDERDKPSLNDSESIIREAIAKEKREEDMQLTDKAMAALREQHNLEFHDRGLRRAYREFIEQRTT